MMQTLLDTVAREGIRRRLDTLAPDARPAWGTLDAPGMVCHVSDQLRVALGLIPLQRRVDTLFRRSLLKWMVLYSSFEPPHGKVKTTREMLTSRPTTWTADVAECARLIEAVGHGSASAAHPAFGALDAKEWGILCWKHLDYHLRQFGI
jgi:hypothetical protein